MPQGEGWTVPLMNERKVCTRTGHSGYLSRFPVPLEQGSDTTQLSLHPHDGVLPRRRVWRWVVHAAKDQGTQMHLIHLEAHTETKGSRKGNCSLGSKFQKLL